MRNLSVGDIVQDFVSLFYPQYCLACSAVLFKGEETVCTRCMLEMPQTGHHLNPRGNTLYERFAGRLPLEMMSALFKFSKRGTIQHLLHQLKYKNHPEIGIMLGKVYGNRLKTCIDWPIDLILPVPLHESRARRRGYNQSAKFAEGLSMSLGIPFSDEVLRRKIGTTSQTNKSKLLRWENVGDVFAVKKRDEIEGRRVMLVDDVVTTGATLEACGSVLLRHGCQALSIVCIAEA